MDLRCGEVGLARIRRSGRKGSDRAGGQTALACENAQRYRTIQDHATKLQAEVAERKRAEERFRMLVESAPTGIVIIDSGGRIVDANPHTLQMFGYSRDELFGRTVETLLPTALRAAHGKHRASFVSNPHARPMGMGQTEFLRNHAKAASTVVRTTSPSILEL